MSLSTRYNPKETETKWYEHWEKNNYFHSEPDEREPFTIVIPPPNVTGVLHMGHMLNNTIQDILIRRARLQGKNACWVPGTDHASIATEAKVVQLLRKKGIKKSDIPREEFLKYAFEWKEKYGGIILDQLKRLGASCDWQRTRFTMEPSLSSAVLHVFVDLHKKGKIYRGLRMTNWDPEAQTVLSNEEVIHKEENSQLFYLRYQLEGNPAESLSRELGSIIIATQRPETIMADTAIAVHPDDERFKHLIGKKALIPLINKPIPIIADTYVDREFGTGALKITPAHDQNDNEIGQRHNLPVVDILTADGKLNEQAQILVGQDRFVARKNIKKLLEDGGYLVKLEDYHTSIGRSERTDAVVEPRLTLQWFLDMKDFAKTALGAVSSGEVKFYPESMWNMYYQWLNEDNVRDWCISRQLWWGQRIPAWYLQSSVHSPQSTDGSTQDSMFVAETAEEALALAKEKTGDPDLTLADLRQDEDVVDTWFSSWLWPIAVFDGFAPKESLREKQDELKYYYPTNVLVTGWDIMFFWVARMIMAGYEWSEELLGKDLKGRQPFNDVYFTGMVRDNKRRKMSKSLGNSPEALELIENYGADGVRFGMLSSGAAGNDIIFDAPFDQETKAVLNESKLCEQGRNFCNKMWNALRLVKGWQVTDMEQSPKGTSAINKLAINWLENKFNSVMEEAEANFAQYRLSDVLMSLYTFIWDDFCSWYLEMIKPAYSAEGESAPIDRTTYEATLALYEKMMVALHPFMPFVTEEIWHQLRERKEGDDCIVSRYPAIGSYDKTLISQVGKAKDVITKIRDTRNTNGISLKESLLLFVEASKNGRSLFKQEGLKEMLVKMANLSAVKMTETEPPSTVSFLSGNEKYYLEINVVIDKDAERERIQKELEYHLGFIASVQKKLSNERFVSGAPEQVVDVERRKLADGEEKIRMLEESLEKL